jgi:hypothetical protein
MGFPASAMTVDRGPLVSWYSSHERDASGQPLTAIYLAELQRDA